MGVAEDMAAGADIVSSNLFAADIIILSPGGSVKRPFAPQPRQPLRLDKGALACKRAAEWHNMNPRLTA